MSAVLTIALPVFAVITAGLLAGRFKVIPAEDVAPLNRFVFRVAMPVSLFALTARSEPPGAENAVLGATYAGAVLLVMGGAYWTARRIFASPPQEAGAHAFACGLGNAVFIGLPIALSIPGWAPNYVTLLLVEGTVVIGLGAVLLSPQNNAAGLFSASGLRAVFLRPLQNPLIMGLLGGYLFAIVSGALNFSAPTPMTRFLEILGRAAGPTALFSIGLFLATTPLARLDAVGGRIAHIIFMKMVLLPALFLGGLAAQGIDDPLIMGPAALFAVVPTAVGAFVINATAGVYARETAAAVAVTSVLSLFSVSAVLVVLGV